MKLSDILADQGHARVHDRPAGNVGRSGVGDGGAQLRLAGGLRTDKVVGIITERDILRACAAQNRPLSEVRVEERMTRNVITGSASDKISDVMGWMTEMRIRHLPVLEKGRLAGMVSIGDIVKAEHSLLSVENQYLKHYIQS